MQVDRKWQKTRSRDRKSSSGRQEVAGDQQQRDLTRSAGSQEVAAKSQQGIITENAL